MSNIGQSLLKGAEQSLSYAKGDRKSSKTYQIKIPEKIRILIAKAHENCIGIRFQLDILSNIINRKIPMPKPTDLKKLIAQLCDALPAHAGTLKKDFEKNCRQIVPAFLNKLDLVTREEFDTQSKVLARTRKKLEALEEQIKELEHSLKPKRK